MPLPPDLHVHTEWSWDAPNGHMERSCERALEVGLPALAFTEHADWALVHAGQHAVDVEGYLEAVERCRSRFKDLRIFTGVELGEPHWFPKESATVLAGGRLDRVHGSIHCIRLDGGYLDASQFRQREGLDFPAAVRAYLRETLAMVDSGQPFETLAHLDYPKRYRARWWRRSRGASRAAWPWRTRRRFWRHRPIESRPSALISASAAAASCSTRHTHTSWS